MPERAGITATLVDTESGMLVSFSVPDGGTVAARAVARQCDLLGPSWRVRCLSSVESIRADLRNDGRDGTWRRGRIEGGILGRIGRADLIEAPMVRHGRGATEVAARRRRDDG